MRVTKTTAKISGKQQTTINRRFDIARTRSSFNRINREGCYGPTTKTLTLTQERKLNKTTTTTFQREHNGVQPLEARSPQNNKAMTNGGITGGGSIIHDHLTRYWVGNEQVKTFPLVKRCLFTVACALFLSLGEGPQQPELYDHFMDMLNGMLQIPVDFPRTLYRKARIGSNQIRRILQRVIDERRVDLASGLASSDQDLLSYLLYNVDGRENPLSDSDIKDNILQLLMAGHDTNDVTVTLLLRNLALNPHCYRQVLQEQLNITSEKGEKLLRWDDIQRMKYTWNATQETMRLDPPAGGTRRKAIADISYGGFTIPKGWKNREGHPQASLSAGSGRDLSCQFRAKQFGGRMEFGVPYVEKDDLLWGAEWLQRASANSSYVSYIQANRHTFGAEDNVIIFIWDDKHAGTGDISRN
ncbi:hypothetical protein KI387_023587 [Taxus chinensis]|uniref:Cytochrome P450 n=1 Tax=Taxus chinensis TaxID=29808 RepID=A0AA38LAW8_TAXCH|nr:hypothetical protein KI387_023587 [Taxus chinensis]